MNYYEVLGVNKNSSIEDIKRAYRKLAMKHHPDRSGGNDTHFKRIQEAYDVLSNPQKKAEYDNPNPWAGAESFNFDDVFGNIFSNAQRGTRNPDSRINIEISLEQAINGCRFTLDLSGGSVVLELPAGVRDGAKLKISGRGQQKFARLPPGDLIVIVHIKMPPQWARQQDDLYVRGEIDALSAMIGCDFELLHITGKKYKITIPPGTQPGDKIRLKGLGMTNPNNSIVGSLYVIVDIVIPTVIDKETSEELNKIRGKLYGK